ncbi:MAG: hypothetical protein U0263_03910 [Polyangiaceae bacterium]
MSRRVCLFVAFALLLVAPLGGGTAGCLVGARPEAQHLEHPGGRSLALPAPLAWGCGVLSIGATTGAATGSALGFVAGAVALVLAGFAERSARRRERPSERLHRAVLPALASVGVGVLVLVAFARVRQNVAERTAASRRACRDQRAEVGVLWASYKESAPHQRKSVSFVERAVASDYALDELCRAARAVPSDAGSSQYRAAMAATESAFETCVKVELHPNGAPTRCTR